MLVLYAQQFFATFWKLHFPKIDSRVDANDEEMCWSVHLLDIPNDKLRCLENSTHCSLCSLHLPMLLFWSHCLVISSNNVCGVLQIFKDNRFGVDKNRIRIKILSI